MDNITRQIAGFAAEMSFELLPEHVIAAGTRYLIDSLACAVAAHDCKPAQIGLRVARGAVPERYPGRILLHRERSIAELAAFVNTAMIRNLDFNDQYPGGHPSDCLGAFLAITEAAGADGSRLLSGTIVAYELFVRISDATGLRYKGWDQGFAIGIWTAAGVGHLLGLPPDRIAEAIAITTVANVAMRNTRSSFDLEWIGATWSISRLAPTHLPSPRLEASPRSGIQKRERPRITVFPTFSREL